MIQVGSKVFGNEIIGCGVVTAIVNGYADVSWENPTFAPKRMYPVDILTLVIKVGDKVRHRIFGVGVVVAVRGGVCDVRWNQWEKEQSHYIGHMEIIEEEPVVVTEW